VVTLDKNKKKDGIIYIMKTGKAESRDKKRSKRNKMKVDNKSIFIIQRVIIKKGTKKDGKK